MALHIQMSEEAEAKMKRASLLNKLTSLAACFGFLGIGGAMLYFTVILIGNVQTPAFETYVAPSEDAAPSKKPKVKELTSKTSPPNSQIAPSVIVSSSAAAVAMAEVDIPTTDVVVGTGLEIDMGLGSGLGSGLGEAGGGLGSSDSGGSTLEGTFYDLKLTRTGAKTGITLDPNTHWLAGDGPSRVATIIGEFITKNWDEKILSKYYKSPTKLYASYFLLPACNAAYGPKAFKVEGKVQPSGWVVVYRGKVRAPKTGKFRFVGTADDGITVRFNKKTVLEAGYCIPSGIKLNLSGEQLRGLAGSPDYKENYKKHPGHEDYILYPENSGWWSHGTGGLMGGNIINVVEGREYPIEVLATEIPGGVFGFMLFMEDLSAPRTENGQRVFDIFRTNFSLPNMEELNKELQENGAMMGGSAAPKFNEDSPIWTVVP